MRLNSFMFPKDFEVPKMKVPIKHNIVFSLGQGKNWGQLPLRKNPAALKLRRDISTEERIHIQVCKVVIQLLQLPGFY